MKVSGGYIPILLDCHSDDGEVIKSVETYMRVDNIDCYFNTPTNDTVIYVNGVEFVTPLSIQEIDDLII